MTTQNINNTSEQNNKNINWMKHFASTLIFKTNNQSILDNFTNCDTGKEKMVTQNLKYYN